MKRQTFLFAAIVSALGSSFSAAQAQTSSSPADWPAGVKQLLDRFDSTATSATTLDGSGRAALFADDAIFLNAFGARKEGRAAIDSTWAQIYSSRSFSAAHIERLEKRVRVLSPDLVLVDHLERLTGQQGPNSGRVLPPRTTHITLILRRAGQRDWRIIYYRAGDDRILRDERAARLHLDSLENLVKQRKGDLQ